MKTWLTGQPMLQSTILMKIDFIMQITPENLHRIKNKPLREKNKRKKLFSFLWGYCNSIICYEYGIKFVY